jgi:hypothetical protein
MWICSIDSEKVVRVFSALLTPAIAIIAVYIAYRQHKTSNLQHRLALFDRRLVVFNSTMKMVASVLQEARAELDECFKYISETRDHEFLFGPEVGTFINEVYSKAVALHTHLAVEPRGGPRLVELLDWFSGQMGEGRKIFKKYMDFTKP